jgi:Tfp pilus assembly protein PilX
MNKKASILVVTLIIIVVIGAFSVGLFFFAERENQHVQNYHFQVQTFNAAEIGIDRALVWLEISHRAGVVPIQAASSVDGFDVVVDGFVVNELLSNELNTTVEAFGNYSYSYYIEPFSGGAIPNGGGSIGQGGGYNSPDATLESFYKITSFGFGPNDSVSHLEVVVSYRL